MSAPAALDEYQPTIAEIREILSATHRNEKDFKVESFRTVLAQIIQDRNAIVNLIKEHVKKKEERDEIIHEFETKLPQKDSKVNAHAFSKKECVELITDIYFVMSFIMETKENDRIPSSFRNLFGLVNKVKGLIRRNKNTEISSHFVKLTEQMQKRIYN